MTKVNKILILTLAMALVAAPAMALTTTADIFFTIGNGGGLDQYTLGPGQYFANLHITVDSGMQASFDLTGGSGSYGGNPVNFAFVGTSSTAHVLGLSVAPAPTGTGFGLTITNIAYTALNAATPTLAAFQGNPGAQFDGFGKFNTGINTNTNGWAGAIQEITFQSVQNFANANAVLAALTGNYRVTGNPNNPNYNFLGWLGAVDVGGYFPNSSGSSPQSGTAVNGILLLPFPPASCSWVPASWVCSAGGGSPN